MSILQTEKLTKVYGKGENEVRALDGVSIGIEKGELLLSSAARAAASPPFSI